MDLQGLRAFVAVGHHGTIRGAANALGYSESAVSRHVAAFERSVGAPAFARERAGMVLTEVGASILPLATEVLETVAAIGHARNAVRPSRHTRARPGVGAVQDLQPAVHDTQGGRAD